VDNVLMFCASRSVRIAAALIFCAVAAPACSKVQARTPAADPVEPPALATPEPPSRLKVPVPVDPPAAAGSTTEKPPVPAGRGKPPAATPPAGSSSTVLPPTPPEPATSPVIQASADVEQKARDRLRQAQADLKRVQVTGLSADAKEQYNSAQRFARMADDALRAKNFVYALYCADKGATLASLLVKAGGRAPIA
jgi:hypothetical protein